MTSLAKAPASTVQILGAEKALFRALKTKGNTPKYGLIFHSTFIGRAKQRNKGRISRYLANKCSIATRIDAFMDQGTSVFGEKMRDQVIGSLFCLQAACKQLCSTRDHCCCAWEQETMPRGPRSIFSVFLLWYYSAVSEVPVRAGGREVAILRRWGSSPKECHGDGRGYGAIQGGRWRRCDGGG